MIERYNQELFAAISNIKFRFQKSSLLFVDFLLLLVDLLLGLSENGLNFLQDLLGLVDLWYFVVLRHVHAGVDAGAEVKLKWVKCQS